MRKLAPLVFLALIHAACTPTIPPGVVDTPLGKVQIVDHEYRNHITALLEEVRALRTEVRNISLESRQDKAQGEAYRECESAFLEENERREDALTTYAKSLGIPWDEQSADPRTSKYRKEYDEWHDEAYNRCEKIRPYNAMPSC